MQGTEYAIASSNLINIEFHSCTVESSTRLP